jgi:hypothetical protein
MLAAMVWIAMIVGAPEFVLTSYLPGFAGGLVLCALHGYYEHAHGTTSYYGRLYNLVFFNDGFHVEHHRHPATHWTQLPECVEGRSRLRQYAAGSPERRVRVRSANISAWPAPLRWVEAFGLEGLERLVIRFRPLQSFVVRTHARAMARVLAGAAGVDRVAIVGGGLFPRTAMVLRELLPDSRITIIDASEAHLECARAFIERGTEFARTGVVPELKLASPPPPELKLEPTYSRVDYVHGKYPRVNVGRFDLAVFPLSFAGERDDLYAHPPARAVIVHDWIWRKRGTSRIVSLLLLKRINLVRL